ncbi:MAG: cytochrome c oxidase assembly factor Coa1 family protein [Algibacter sp.]
MEEAKQKSWFGRNWPWVLPVGGCLTLIILFVIGIGAAVFGITKAVSGSEPYEYAYEKAIQNEYVIEALGTPIEKGFVGSNSSYSLNNGESRVSLTIPINGSLNDAFIYVEGIKENDEWVYTKLYVDIKNDDNDVNLLDTDIEDVRF